MTSALITGANRGIGLALAQEALTRGMSVTGTSRGEPPALPGLDWQRLDVTDPASTAALGAAWGTRPLSLLVCNAGIYPDEHLAPDDPALWHAGFATNVMGVYLTIRALLPALRAGRGKIAIIASQMGSSARAPGGSLIYRASKAAAINLGRNLACDLRDDGIAVGIYHPGWVQTDMGGSGADITVAVSAKGLMQRFEALGIDRSGVFEDWQGNALPF